VHGRDYAEVLNGEYEDIEEVKAAVILSQEPGLKNHDDDNLKGYDVVELSLGAVIVLQIQPFLPSSDVRSNPNTYSELCQLIDQSLKESHLEYRLI
jgi:hypothetical protein